MYKFISGMGHTRWAAWLPRQGLELGGVTGEHFVLLSTLSNAYTYITNLTVSLVIQKSHPMLRMALSRAEQLAGFARILAEAPVVLRTPPFPVGCLLSTDIDGPISTSFDKKVLKIVCNDHTIRYSTIQISVSAIQRLAFSTLCALPSQTIHNIYYSKEIVCLYFPNLSVCNSNLHVLDERANGPHASWRLVSVEALRQASLPVFRADPDELNELERDPAGSVPEPTIVTVYPRCKT